MCRHSRERYELPDGTCCLCRVNEDGYYTLRECADILGISKERVRQIESAALRRLRSAGLVLSGMSEYIGIEPRAARMEAKPRKTYKGPYPMQVGERNRKPWAVNILTDGVQSGSRRFMTLEEAESWMSEKTSKHGSGE